MKAERFKLTEKFKEGTIGREELLGLRNILLKDIYHMSRRECECMLVCFLLGITEAALKLEYITMAIETGERVLIN